MLITQLVFHSRDWLNYCAVLYAYSKLCKVLNDHIVRHVTGTGSGLLGGIPRVVVQISALTLKGPL
jgi:hypothetical protein